MFEIKASDNKTSARTGSIRTAHGKIKTPFFMPVSTKGTVKYIDFEELKKIGTDCVISNSLLLYQKPGLKLIKKAGGLHKFYNWDKGIFTDSGGFQTLDEFFKQKSTHDGVYFNSPYSGKIELIKPEDSMNIQLTLRPDIAMCLDDVPLHNDNLQTTRSKTLTTHSWAKRCKEYHDEHNYEGKKRQLLFGIAQGGMYKDLRKKSINFIKKQNFDGIALGGLAIGESIGTMFDMIKTSVPHIPKEKPRYLMGVGSPEDLLKCISLGVDCFDSTFPTQNARHGTIFTWNGKLKILNSKYKEDFSQLQDDCDCYVCKNYSKAYIHHLLKINEATGKKLASYHNLYFVQRLMEKIRQKIQDNKFEKFKEDFISKYKR
jgi:queuine tRNA-ribosyltransferase